MPASWWLARPTNASGEGSHRSVPTNSTTPRSPTSSSATRGTAGGDELCCVARLGPSNLNDAGPRTDCCRLMAARSLPVARKALPADRHRQGPRLWPGETPSPARSTLRRRSNTAWALNTAWTLSCRRERRRFPRRNHRCRREPASAPGRDPRGQRSHRARSAVRLRRARSAAATRVGRPVEPVRRVRVAGYRPPPTADLAADIETDRCGGAGRADRRAGHGAPADERLDRWSEADPAHRHRAAPIPASDRCLDRRPVHRRGRGCDEGGPTGRSRPPWPPEPPTAGGIPVGFADDTEYLGCLERAAVGRVLAVPSDVVRPGNRSDSFRRHTLAHLIIAPDLALVSVWSPTFLTTLLDELFTDPIAVLAVAADLDRRGAARAAEVLHADASEEEIVAALWPPARHHQLLDRRHRSELRPPTSTAIPGGCDPAEGFARHRGLCLVPADRARRRRAGRALPRLRVRTGRRRRPRRCSPMRSRSALATSRSSPPVVASTDTGLGECGGDRGSRRHVPAPPVRRPGPATADLVGEKLGETFVAAALTAAIGPSHGDQPKAESSGDALVIPVACPSPH